MLTARTLEVFDLGGKRIVACEMAGQDPMKFLDRDFVFYDANGRFAGRIRIDGVSTASDAKRRVCDFSYSGDEILSAQLGGRSVIQEELPRSPDGNPGEQR